MHRGCLVNSVFPLQDRVAPVPSASAMRTPAWFFIGLLVAGGFAQGAIKTPENAPIEITSTGGTRYENGIATAHDNVEIPVGDPDIYADDARYNSATHEITADGHVRIYRDEVYNKDTEEKGIAEIIIGKQRNGPIGDFKLVFRNDITKFFNYEPQPEYSGP